MANSVTDTEHQIFLLQQRLALSSFQLFLSQIQNTSEVLKIRVLQIVFDILMVHENDFLGGEGENVGWNKVGMSY